MTDERKQNKKKKQGVKREGEEGSKNLTGKLDVEADAGEKDLTLDEYLRAQLAALLNIQFVPTGRDIYKHEHKPDIEARAAELLPTIKDNNQGGARQKALAELWNSLTEDEKGIYETRAKQPKQQQDIDE